MPNRIILKSNIYSSDETLREDLIRLEIAGFKPIKTYCFLWMQTIVFERKK